MFAREGQGKTTRLKKKRNKNPLTIYMIIFLVYAKEEKQGSADLDHAHDTGGKNIKNNPDRALTSGVIRQQRKEHFRGTFTRHPLTLTVFTDFVCLDSGSVSQGSISMLK